MRVQGTVMPTDRRSAAIRPCGTRPPVSPLDKASVIWCTGWRVFERRGSSPDTHGPEVDTRHRRAFAALAVALPATFLVLLALAIPGGPALADPVQWQRYNAQWLRYRDSNTCWSWTDGCNVCRKAWFSKAATCTQLACPETRQKFKCLLGF